MEMVEILHPNLSKTLARYGLWLLKFYFRIDIEGLEHLPRKGGALIIPNHSGFAGADAVLLTFLIKRNTRRRARLLAHRAFFDFSKKLKEISESHGLKKASFSEGTSILKRGNLLILFPEGETGNFKSTLDRYHLAQFHTGFLRMAIETGAPIVPCMVIGAEESHLNLGNLNFSKIIKSMRVPIPLNLFPLPAKWKIRFYPPVDPSTFDPGAQDDPKKLKTLAQRFQKNLQKEIRKEIKHRPFIYFEKTGRLAKIVKKKLKKLQ
ncbi:1-acyl-sn-glycerol-3-phosphate acyltransferase [bacterium]|nr:1-acyl-sn-glycerol-3-phosphate acyltransferase [bacterium]